MGRTFSTTWAWLGMLAVGCWFSACGDDDGAGSTDSPDGGGSDAPDELAATWGPINRDCLENTRPLTGRGAKRGPCCYRGEPNSLRVEAYGDGPAAELEYRAQLVSTANHPDTLGLMAIRSLSLARVDLEQQNLLVRLVHPQKDGEFASGSGTITMGQGRYNCDGTYSFYNDKAAPTGEEFPGGDDPARWVKQVIPITVDGTKSGREAAFIAFDDNYSGHSYLPFVSSDTYEYQWELVTQHLDILELSTDPKDIDCQGRWTGSQWQPGGRIETFVSLKDNHLASNAIPDLMGETFSQLIAFAIIAKADRRDELDPLGERCVPEPSNPDALCPWKKLPDSLCPETEKERDLFRCHVGYEDNPDGVAVNCTMTPPETPRSDPQGDQGQCCDPLADESSGLPACNAYRIESEVVFAAADITDEDGGPVEDCRIK